MNNEFTLKELPEIISAASNNAYGILALSVITVGVLAYLLFFKEASRTRLLVLGWTSICIGLLSYIAIASQNSSDKLCSDKSKQELNIKSTGAESPAIGSLNGSITYGDAVITDKRKE